MVVVVGQRIEEDEDESTREKDESPPSQTVRPGKRPVENLELTLVEVELVSNEDHWESHEAGEKAAHCVGWVYGWMEGLLD